MGRFYTHTTLFVTPLVSLCVTHDVPKELWWKNGRMKRLPLETLTTRFPTLLAFRYTGSWDRFWVKKPTATPSSVVFMAFSINQCLDSESFPTRKRDVCTLNPKSLLQTPSSFLFLSFSFSSGFCIDLNVEICLLLLPNIAFSSRYCSYTSFFFPSFASGFSLLRTPWLRHEVGRELGSSFGSVLRHDSSHAIFSWSGKHV